MVRNTPLNRRGGARNRQPTRRAARRPQPQNTMGLRLPVKQASSLRAGNLLAFSTNVKSQEVLMSLTHEDYARVIHLDTRGLAARGACPRLLQMMEMYEKWLVNGLVIKYIPSVNVTESGSIHIAPDYDPLDNPPDNVTTLSSFYRYKSGAVPQPLTVEMPNPKVGTEYFKGGLYTSPAGPERWCSYGQIVVMTESATLTPGDAIGQLVLEYDITLMGPQLQEHPTINDTTTVTKLELVNTSATNKGKVCSVFDSTTLTSNTLKQLNAADAAVDSSAGTKHVGTLIDMAGAVLTDRFGKALTLGSRIFWNPPDKSFDGTASEIGTYAGSTPWVGALSTASDFGNASDIFIQGAPGIKLLLAAVQQYTS